MVKPPDESNIHVPALKGRRMIRSGVPAGTRIVSRVLPVAVPTRACHRLISVIPPGCLLIGSYINTVWTASIVYSKKSHAC